MSSPGKWIRRTFPYFQPDRLVNSHLLLNGGAWFKHIQSFAPCSPTNHHSASQPASRDWISFHSSRGILTRQPATDCLTSYCVVPSCGKECLLSKRVASLFLELLINFSRVSGNNWVSFRYLHRDRSFVTTHISSLCLIVKWNKSLLASWLLEN